MSTGGEDSGFPGLMRGMREASDRHVAGELLLTRALRLVQRALESSRYGARASVQRGILHLRPEGAYRDLVVTEVDGAPTSRSLTPSGTAWSMVEASGEGVAIDVEAGRWSTLQGVSLRNQRDVTWSGKTQFQLRDRKATHIAALPLRDASNRLTGLATFEIDCPAGIGARFDVWARCDQALQLLLDVAEPLLAALPPREHETGPTSDPHLPVLGRTMTGVVETLGAFAVFEQTILLRGATGTGKSHLARWCHEQSLRDTGPFVVAQLHAVSESLREGELFGWRKGAFTGASQDRKGMVARAEGGTLFIDEIDKLDLSAQGKLLRLLEERRYSVLGEERDRAADVRFIVGTNQDLRTAVAEGTFLEDLYYRVHVLPLEVPPLSRRLDEIAPWAEYMLGKATQQQGRGVTANLTPEAVTALEAHPWPGNLRQLQSVVVRAMAFAGIGQRGSGAIEIGREHVARSLALEGRLGATDLGSALQELARAVVAEAERRHRDGGEPLDLDLTQGLRGAVLLEAVARSGGPREAFEMLGLSSRLQGGNHLRTLRRERDRLQALADLVHIPMPEAWKG